MTTTSRFGRALACAMKQATAGPTLSSEDLVIGRRIARLSKKKARIDTELAKHPHLQEWVAKNGVTRAAAIVAFVRRTLP